MDALLALWKREPARIVAMVVAILALVTAFGIEVTMEQQAAIIGAVIAVIALLGGEITRANVYSPATVAKMNEPNKVPQTTITPPPGPQPTPDYTGDPQFDDLTV